VREAIEKSSRVPAFAKLNLGLRVLYKRPDGYHELRTVFQTISLADRLDIAFKPARITRIQIEGTPEIPDNLVEKAARFVLESLRIQGDVTFHLKKNIPAGAGLGGGSSNAAAVILALPALAGKVLTRDAAHRIATQIGSDVPFFLQGGSALGLGRGEELYPVPDLPAARALLVAPAIHSSTIEAYRDLSPRLTSIPLQNKLNSFQKEIWQREADRGLSGLGEAANDFEEVVFARHPELKRIKARLERFGAKPAAMTGSGSAIFGVFEEAGQLDRAAESFQTGKSSSTNAVFSVSFVSRSQYRFAWRRALKLHVEGTEWPPRSRYAPSQSAR
jgi:4-diphosphocytidyl-2-C-methyl-D-erythritol kinase